MVPDHSISHAVFIPSSSEGFSVGGDTALEQFEGGRDEEHDGMQDDLEMEGFGDEDEGVEGGDDTEDVGVFPYVGGCSRTPKSRKFNHHWHAICPC